MVCCPLEYTQFPARPPVLAAEILSPSTRSKDLLYKREAYETLGVRYYLVVDPEERTTQLLENSEQRYRKSTTGVLELHPGCRIELQLRDLFEA